MRLTLAPHPDTPCEAVHAIAVKVMRAETLLRLHYIVEGALRPGVQHAFPCRRCASPMTLSFVRVDWRAGEPPSDPRSGKAAGLKTLPLPTRVGEPLPANGACAHFRR
jgi:hypothetical protein